MQVHLVSEHIWCDDYLVRSFYLKNLKTGETRTVTQFHFLSWPDHGVPPNTKPLLDFRRYAVESRISSRQAPSSLVLVAPSPGSHFILCCRKVNKSYRGRSCPIVVHCR